MLCFAKVILLISEFLKHTYTIFTIRLGCFRSGSVFPFVSVRTLFYAYVLGFERHFCFGWVVVVMAEVYGRGED